jgi:hypothetical protein
MSKGLYRNYTYPSQMRKCNWEMVAVQELHPSVETAAHQMLKTKKRRKTKEEISLAFFCSGKSGKVFRGG